MSRHFRHVLGVPQVIGEWRGTLFSWLANAVLQESAIESNPLDRGHQDRIVSYNQEITVIKETLAQQQNVLSQAQFGWGLSRIVTRTDPESQDAIGQFRSRPAYHGSREPSNRNAAYREDDDLRPRVAQAPTGNDPQNQSIDGVQGLLLQDGLVFVEKRIREFGEMQDRASDLGEWVPASFVLFH